MKENYDIDFLLKKYEENDKNWEKTAESLGINDRTLRNWRKEAQLAKSISLARSGTNTIREWAKKLGMSVKDLNEYIKKYELLGKSNAITPKRHDLEFSDWNSMEDLKPFTKDIDARNPKQIGYRHAEWNFDDDILLWWFHDAHVGCKYTLHEKILEDMDLLMDTPNAYSFWGGDYCDNFTKRGHGSGMYDQIMTIQQQKNWIKTIALDTGDRILGILQGCHDEWMYEQSEFDFSQYLGNKIKGYWLGFQGYLTLHVGEQDYTIFGKHDYPFWSSDNPAHGLRKFYRRYSLDKYKIDVIFGAHRHVFDIDYGFERGRLVYFVRGDSYKITDRFINKKGYPESLIRMPCVIFRSKEREMVAFETLQQGVKYL